MLQAQDQVSDKNEKEVEIHQGKEKHLWVVIKFALTKEYLLMSF